jgi:hypothetical protein
MQFSAASPGFGLTVLGDSWNWLIAPVAESCIALLIARFLQKALKNTLV